MESVTKDGPMDMETMSGLLEKATRYVKNNCTTHLSTTLMADRTSTSSTVSHNDNRITLTPALKGQSGHTANPGNNQLSGIFLTIHTEYESSPGFDPHHVVVPMAQLFNHNFYFSDFYCMNVGRPHYVQIVVAKPETEADSFCQKYFPKLDPESNPFLIVERKNKSTVIQARYPGQDHLSTVFVEVFYTEKIVVDLGGDDTTTRRLPRSQHCSVCE